MYNYINRTFKYILILPLDSEVEFLFVHQSNILLTQL